VSMIPPPPPMPGAAFPGARARIRWGIGDAILAFVVGTICALVAAAFVIDSPKPLQLIVLIAAQDFGIIGWLAVVARRKGLGSLRADFGLTLRPAAGSWFRDVKWFFAGVGLQIVALIPTQLLVEIHGSTAKQDVVSTADKARGLEVVLMVLAVALLAPLTEELLFRGALLRSALRKTTPDRAVFITAAAFGLVHAIGDPSVGTLVALPAIMLLGVVSGYQAVRTGNLSRSVMLHIGFNALSVVLLFTT
jgi:uncharacterized protein